jgi:hypothetical protein
VIVSTYEENNTGINIYVWKIPQNPTQHINQDHLDCSIHKHKLASFQNYPVQTICY